MKQIYFFNFFDEFGGSCLVQELCLTVASQRAAMHAQVSFGNQNYQFDLTLPNLHRS